MSDLFSKYQIPKEVNFSISPVEGGGFIATFPDLPGCATQGEDFSDLLENVNDAVLTYFDVPRKEAYNVFHELRINGQVVASAVPEHQYATAR